MRNLMLWVFGALLVMATPCAWAAKYVDGNNLFSAVSSGAKRPYALGFVLGVNDALDLTLVCAPPEVKVEQLLDVVSAYLRDNPAKRHMPAVDLVYLALVDVYPCPQKR